MLNLRTRPVRAFCSVSHSRLAYSGHHEIPSTRAEGLRAGDVRRRQRACWTAGRRARGPRGSARWNVYKYVAQGIESLPAELTIQPASDKTLILMSNGEKLAELYDENRTVVTLDQIAPIMRTAQVAIEDTRFYQHGALDLKGTLRALVRTGSGTDVQGGSTLTQQYIKQVRVEAAQAAGDQAGVLAAQEQALQRKVLELRCAIALETKYSKDEIRNRYLNIAYYGDGTYGVEAAAKHYCGVTAKDLTLAQAAMLAGLTQNPVATDPVNHPQAALDRRDVVINRMLELGLISADDAAKAKATPFDVSKVVVSRTGCVGTAYPFMCDYVVR